MSWLLIVFNEASLAVILVAAMTIYLRRPRPACLRQHAMQLALLIVAGGAFASLVAPVYWDDAPRWWAVMLRFGVAIIALRWLWYAVWGGVPIATGGDVEPGRP